MQLETMHSTIEGRIATIVLNRPHVLNCANCQWLRDFEVLLDDIAAIPTLRVLVIRGAGRAFCSGIDLTALSSGEIDREFFRGWEMALRRLETIQPLVIAAIHSHCIGGGLQLALACDLRLAREDARFGVTAVKEGIIPGLGMWRLARHAGLGRAKRLSLTADVIDVHQAEAWGLVDYLATTETFEARIAELADRILEMAPTSTSLTKSLANMAFDGSYDDLIDVFCEYQARATSSPEHRRAMAARRAKRNHGQLC